MCENHNPLGMLRRSTGVRLLVLFTSFFFLLLVAAGIGAVLMEVPAINGRTAVLLTSVVQCLLAFCVPAWLTARFSSGHPLKFLGLASSPGIRAYIGVVIVYVLALPAMNQLIIWNEQIHFPEWAAGIEATLREWERSNGEVSELALSASGFWQMIAGVCVIGVLTGFSEEVFFRGTMQNIFSDSGVGKGVAVWGAAAIFSAVHFQFFGFFPRLLMGAFFGYLLVWTGSIWPSVFAHALNNSIVVVSALICGEGSGDPVGNIGATTDGSLPWAAVFSLAATALFFFHFRNTLFKRVPQSTI